MTNSVRFRFADDEDGTGELELAFHINGYSGVGRAYFEPRKLDQQLDELAAYPLPAAGTSAIRGGYWELADGAERLIEEHLGFSVHPMGSTGRLAFRVRVAAPGESASDPVQYSASASLPISYAVLPNFVAEMKALLKGEMSEVVLEEDRG